MKSAALSFGFKALWLVGALALLGGAAACVTDPEGTTPDCVQDVDEGSHQVIDNGCNQFAVCVRGDQVVNPAECCKDLKDYELAACLYGYGAGPAPGGGGSSSSSSGK